MKNFLRFFVSAIFTVVFLFPQFAAAINPLYQLQATNFQLGSGSGLSNNTLEFDITIWHTNLPQSGPFLFATGEYYLNFNPAVANGGILSFTIIPGSSEFADPNAIPDNASLSGNLLRIHRNDSLPINPPVISIIYPGTRVIRVKLATTAPSFADLPLELVWRDSTFGDPYTKISGFIDGVNTDITTNGTLVVNNDPPLPVELSSFTSIVNRNNITLNWTTSKEINNSGFDIERFDIGEQNTSGWVKSGTVRGNGTTNEPVHYFYNETVNTGKYKYRLKQTDYNGNYEYFELNNDVIIGTPITYSISQNYPNPFNPETRIDYDLAYDGEVNVSVYDITGKEISKLVNGLQQAGYYNIRFNAAGLNSGIYFYRITVNSESGHFISTKKMTLLK